MHGGTWREQLSEMLSPIRLYQEPFRGMGVGGVIEDLPEAARILGVVLERYDFNMNNREFLGCAPGTLWVGVIGLTVILRGRFMLEMGFDFDPKGLFEGWMPRTILGRANFNEIPELLPCDV